MKKVFLLIVLCVTMGTGFAQSRRASASRNQNSGQTGFSLGARLGVGIPSYTVGSDIKDMAGDYSVKIDGNAGFLFAVQAAYAFTPAMSVQVEGVFTTDDSDIKVEGTKVGTFSAPSLQIPVLFKYTWITVVDISGLAGFYFTVPTGDGKITINGSSTKGDWTPSGGFVFGGAVGKFLGIGQLFADIRFAFDFVDSTADYNGSDTEILKKIATQISVGYSIPIGGKR